MQAEAFSYEDERTINQVQRALILKAFPGFAALPPADLALLVSITKERFFEKGAVLLEPGVPVNAFYLIVEGEVRTLIDGKPNDTFGPRTAVGGLAALTGDPEGTHCEALTDTVTLELGTEDMQDLFEDSFRVLAGVLTAMARGLRDLQQKLGGAAIGSARRFEPLDFEGDLGLVERMFFLRKTTNWGSTRIEPLASLARSAHVEHYPDGARLFDVDEAADCSYVVLAGDLRCTPKDGAPFTFPVGWVVGGLDSLSREPRWYEAVADGKVSVLRLDRSDLFDVLEDHSSEAMSLLRNLAGGMLQGIQRLARSA